MGAYSTSNTLIWESPAALMIVRSDENGINLTEKIFPLWPVSIWVFNENPAFAL